MGHEAEARAKALALLRSQHDFPGVFEFRVVLLPGAVSTVLSAVGVAAGPEASVQDVRERASRRGTYRSLRIRVHLQDAERVLDVYQVLKELDGVVTAL